MIHSLFAKIGSLFLSLGLVLGAVAPVAPLAGAVTPVGSTQFSLAGAGVNSTQSTVPLASFTTPDGRPLIMSMFGSIGYGALEPQSTAKLEDVTFTGITQNTNGTAALTGVTRGNDFVSPYAASTTLAHSHAGGATFILTNTPGFYTQFAAVNNAQTIYGAWTYSSTSPPRYDQPGAQAGGSYIATTSEFASVAYVNATGAGVNVNATQTVKGIVQLATGLQAASSTATGSTGASLALTSSIATDTPNTNTRGTRVLMSTIGGFLNQAWLDLTANWTFTGAVNIAATTAKNFTLNSVAYVFPTTQATASTSALVNDASGNLSWVPISRLIATTTAITTLTGSAATSTVLSITIPGNTLGKTGILRFRFPGSYGLGTNSDASFFAIGYGNSTTTFPIINSSGAGVNGQIGTTEIDIYANGSTNSETISIVSQYTTSGVVGTSKSISLSSTGTYAVDSTQAQPLMITWLGSTSSANFSWNVLTAEILH